MQPCSQSKQDVLVVSDRLSASIANTAQTAAQASTQKNSCREPGVDYFGADLWSRFPASVSCALGQLPSASVVVTEYNDEFA